MGEPPYDRLRSFAKREGHSRVPQAYRDDDDFRLGEWVNGQRNSRRRSKLAEERQRRLEALPGWVWDAREDDWEDGYARLQEFVQRRGHSRVPAAYRDDDGFRLGNWVSHQRIFSRSGKLAEERQRRLEALPGWVWDVKEAAWEDGYARLLQFAERTGHSRVTVKYRDDDGFGLGAWVSHQRILRSRGQLFGGREQRLEALPGWVWDVKEAAWEEAYTRLLRFVEREGHGQVPVLFRDDDGFRLGQWVSVQRTNRKDGQLSEERRRRLEAVPGWVWDAREATKRGS